MNDIDSIKRDILQNVGGMDDIVLQIVLRLKFGLDTSVGPGYSGSSMLITGPIGSGKTFIISEVVKAFKVTFQIINCASITQRNIGESERYLQDIFQYANAHSPSIIVLDDLELLVPDYSCITAMYQVRLSTFFLDTLRRYNCLPLGVFIIGIVNESQLERLNKEVCCSGYMDTILPIPKIDDKRKIALMRILFQDKVLLDDSKLHLIENTASYSCSDFCHIASALIQRSLQEEREITLEMTKEVISAFIPSTTRQFHMVTPLRDGFKGLFGLEREIQTIQSTLLYPLLHPHVYSLYHLQPPAGAVFYGPTASGKSAVIQAIAAEMKNQIQVIEVSCTDILGKYLGESEKKLHAVFTFARQASPCILYLDHIESIAQKRGNDSSEEKTFDRLLSCLLTEVDGLFRNDMSIVVIGSTNDISQLDSAILRPGRLEYHISFSILDYNSRTAYIDYLLTGVEVEASEDRADFVKWVSSHLSWKTAAEVKSVIATALTNLVKERSTALKKQHFVF